ncbi:MAG: MoaD/ThiS family protein [Chloroflexi bacterium]|nr:MoaD/ThiS family protein [Chloroflexota bacterium]
MEITLKLYGNLKRYAPDKKEDARVAIDPATTIRALLLQLGVPDAQVWMSAVNDTVVEDSTALNEGDIVEVFEPIGGGDA